MAALVQVVNDTLGLSDGQFYTKRAITMVVNDTMGLTDSIIKVITSVVTQMFGLTAVPTTRTIVQRNTTTYVITATPAGGFVSNIQLSASGVPGGATAVFDTNPIACDGSSTLTIDTANMSVPTGTYTITVSGIEA